MVNKNDRVPLVSEMTAISVYPNVFSHQFNLFGVDLKHENISLVFFTDSSDQIPLSVKVQLVMKIPLNVAKFIEKLCITQLSIATRVTRKNRQMSIKVAQK